jgi:hypothetical protein
MTNTDEKKKQVEISEDKQNDNRKMNRLNVEKN